MNVGKRNKNFKQVNLQPVCDDIRTELSNLQGPEIRGEKKTIWYRSVSRSKLSGFKNKEINKKSTCEAIFFGSKAYVFNFNEVKQEIIVR